MMFEEMVQLQLVMEDGEPAAKSDAKDAEEDMTTARTDETADAK